VRRTGTTRRYFTYRFGIRGGRGEHVPEPCLRLQVWHGRAREDQLPRIRVRMSSSTVVAHCVSAFAANWRGTTLQALVLQKSA